MRAFSILEKLEVQDVTTYTTIFLLLFSIGILGGKSFGKFIHIQGLSKESYSYVTPTMLKNGQHNLLVIEVDNLYSKEPKLKSVWLMISLFGTNSLTLIPLYPRSESGVTFADPSLSQAFRLTSKGHPSQLFLEQLGQKIWWDNYLLIDEIGVSKVLKILENKEKSNPNLTILATYEAIPPVWFDPEIALKGQVELFNKVCTLMGKLADFGNGNSILQETFAHILTDIRQGGKSHQEKFDHQEIQSLECEFPTLTLDIP